MKHCGKRILISYCTHYECYKIVGNGNNFNGICENKMSVLDKANLKIWIHKDKIDNMKK